MGTVRVYARYGLAVLVAALVGYAFARWTPGCDGCSPRGMAPPVGRAP